MLVIRKAVYLLLAAGVAASLAAPQHGADAASGLFTTTDLGLTSFGAVAVDTATSHVFISSPADNEVVVTDLQGNIVTTIQNEASARAMVVVGSALYVTANGGIDRIDTSSLTVTGTLVSGVAGPVSMVFADGQLWSTSGVCGQWNTQLVSVDPNAGNPILTKYPGAFTGTNGLSYCAPKLSADSTTLLASAGGLTSFDVSTGTPTQVNSAPNFGTGTVSDAEIEPDGSHFLVADQSNTYKEYTLADFTSDGVSYPAERETTAVDFSAGYGGMIGGLVFTNGGNDFYSFQLGNTSSALQVVDFGEPIGGTNDAVGLALTPDASTAYVITDGNVVNQHEFLNVLSVAPPPPPGAPGPPTGVNAVAGVGSAVVSWTPPANHGSAAISGYEIYSSGGATLMVGPTVSRAMLAGLSSSPHVFTVTATNALGTSLPSNFSNQVNPLAGGTFNALTPSRILDTRNGVGGFPIGRIGPNGSINLTVLGVGGVPASHVSGVVVNVTVTDTTGRGWVTAYPAGNAVPTASNLNFVLGQSVPNLVEVAVGANGQVAFNVAGAAADLIVDVEGWVGDNTNSYTASGLFDALTPSRVLDTRFGIGAPPAKLGPNQSLTFQVSNTVGVPGPSDLSAVVLNITATNPTRAGYLTAYPTGTATPLASNVNFAAGETVANRVMVPVGPSGQVTIANATESVDVIADVSGYFTSATYKLGGAAYVGGVPSRLFDTRTCACRLPSGYVLDVGFTPTTPISALSLNVTATDTAGSGWLTVYPDDGSHGYGTPPLASDLNYTPGRTVPNMTVVLLPADDAINIFDAGGGSVDVIVDIDGYYGPVVPAPPIDTPVVKTTESTKAPSRPVLRVSSPRVTAP